jgi:hypothetical protein
MLSIGQAEFQQTVEHVVNELLSFAEEQNLFVNFEQFCRSQYMYDL